MVCRPTSRQQKALSVRVFLLRHRRPLHRPRSQPQDSSPTRSTSRRSCRSRKSTNQSEAGVTATLKIRHLQIAARILREVNKKPILNENKRLNDGQLRGDQTGELLVQPRQRKRGVPAPPNEAQVDHVYPKSKGGPNTFSNAEVRSRRNNLRKGNKLERCNRTLAVPGPAKYCGHYKRAHSRWIELGAILIAR